MYGRTAAALVFILLLSSHVFAETKTYGKGVHLKQQTPISELLDNSGRYLGKKVQIRGMIAEVCTSRGCWINIAGDRPGDKILVKVRDDEIVFPVHSSGRMAVVEGIVDELDLSKKQLILYRMHLAREGGPPFDPSTIREGEKVIRLLGTGAEIEE